MCGIAGVFGPGESALLKSATWRMVQAQIHRGPDDEGVIDLVALDGESNVLLGSRRLAIIDLSSDGHQPMANDDQTVWLVYNGEVYNFMELRVGLESKGHRFRSRTDTEVILRLYEEYGEDAIPMLSGMFSIAIWDHRKASLLLARDRLGEKPLYYAWHENRLVFASEIKALISSELIPRKLNNNAVEAFLNFGSVPSPMTILQGVSSLEPGCVMTVREGKTTMRRYWDLVFEEDRDLGEREASELLRERLQRAVTSRLVSDVPVGVFLSGGLDSSTIVALARQTVTGRLRTFSIRFEQPEFDEGHFARLVSDRFDTEHTEHLLTAGEVWGDLDAIVSAMDQPSTDGVNTYFVSKVARSSGAVVAHSGVGGDELFGGYSTFWLSAKLCRMGRLLDSLYIGRPAARMALSCIPSNRKFQRVRSFLGRAPSSENAYLILRGLFLDEARERIRGAGLPSSAQDWNALEYLDQISSGYSENLGNRISRLELSTYMHNTLLRDVDAMSMAHSLEVRAPFLDHTLVEFISKIPSKHKFGGKPKRLLINAMRDLLPHEVIDRTKGAFAIPYDGWIRDEWRSSFEELLMDRGSSVSDMFDESGVRQLWRAFLDKRVPWSQVWGIFILQLWVRRHIDGAASVETAGHQLHV